MMIRFLPMCLLGSILLVSTGVGQEENYFSLGNAQDVDAVSAGKGGSAVATSNNLAALYYNPALLSSIRKHEAHFSLARDGLQSVGSHPGFRQVESSLQEIHFRSFGIVKPIPTSRGGLTFAFGAFAPRNFADQLAFEDSKGRYEYQATGQLNQYRLGMGIDLSPNVVFGLALGLSHGKERIRLVDGIEDRFVDSYSGHVVEPALLFRLLPGLRLGLTITAWERYHLSRKALFGDEERAFKENFYLHHPMKARLGLGYTGNKFQLSVDYGVSDYRDLESFREDEEFPLPNPGYAPEHLVAVGGEFFLLPLGTVLRAGYQYTALPEPVERRTYNRHSASIGLGLVMNGSVGVDLAHRFGFWEGEGKDHYQKSQLHQTFLSLSYRY